MKMWIVWLIIALLPVNIALADDPPDPPSDFTANQTATNTVNLTWTKGNGANTTVVRGSDSSHPASITDGYEIYNGTGTSVAIDGLNLSSLTFYFSAWSYNGTDYSTSFVETMAGGNQFNFFSLLFVALILSIIGARSSYYIVQFLAGFAWIGLGVYWNAHPTFETSSPEHTVFYILFWGLALAMMFMPMWYSREKGIKISAISTISRHESREIYLQRLDKAIRGRR